MPLQIFTIDAFTKQAFAGNPAATVLVEQFPDESLMQKIAMEMNLSETAFVKPLDQNRFHLRWFTPSQEVKLCGHATLAMSHYLREINAIDPIADLVFETLSGELIIKFEQELIVMNFPAAYPEQSINHLLPLLDEVVGAQPYKCLGLAEQNITVVLETESAIANFQPDFAKIAQLDGYRLLITAIADSAKDYDFVSRFFAPAAGINEDPVTGSAHCTLTPYWSERLGKSALKAKQLSQRTGELEVVNLQDRVLLKGYAVTVMRGSLEI